MEININETAQVSWKQVAVQKQERLRTGASVPCVISVLKNALQKALPSSNT